MKKILSFTMGILLIPVLMFAQNVGDAEELIYYKRYTGAQQMLNGIVSREPANAEAWYWLAQAYIHDDSTSAITDLVQRAPENIHNEPYFQVARGHLLLTQHKKDSANLLFEQAVKKTRSKDAGILAAVARAHISTPAGDGQAALDMLKKAIKRDKKNPALYTLMGDAHRKMGNGEEAYKAYNQALSKNAAYAAAHYKIGKIFASQNNPSVYLKYFVQAIDADPKYAPALYDLYYHYYFTDANKAMAYFNRYIANSDREPENDYRYTDLLYLTKKYEEAIDKAQQLLSQPQADTITRLHKLLAYSYLGLNDTANAISSMNNYFSYEADSNLVAKDFETMATLYETMDGAEDSVLVNYEKAAAITNDTMARYTYYRKIADLYKERDDFASQAYWLGKVYENNDRASNLDLFNWGVAHFKAEQYKEADTVFGRYIEKYPDQGFGYYWRARTNALRDSSMQEGLAIPYYDQLIDVIEEKDTITSTHKKWLVQAYGYKAAWETNEQNDYAAAIENLNKVLEIDPANDDARRYIAILEKKVSAGAESEGKN
ncbi:tetratricopeptide repeat protein [Niastella populi]|uniref:Tetratricopeptide repeat protein n=1 Tax=Niastella populi TaxID=550983 RepID=A0A1V9EVS2_9BACT|nr:tetratricopeptide repeat protein [Niastella populi]OQP50240.1 hypothetical protein A4R26_29885 [Niastella populi]